MSMPEYYRKFYRIWLRYASVMLLAGLLLGIIFAESAKKAPVSTSLPAGMHLESIIILALVHGHTFLVGALLPLAFSWMLYLGSTLGFQPVSERALRWGNGFYLPGAALAIVLMLYKGYHFLLGVRSGQMDLHLLNESFFFGNHLLRGVVYGVAHVAMAAGMGTIVISFWRSMKSARSSST